MTNRSPALRHFIRMKKGTSMKMQYLPVHREVITATLTERSVEQMKFAAKPRVKEGRIVPWKLSKLLLRSAFRHGNALEYVEFLSTDVFHWCGEKFTPTQAVYQWGSVSIEVMHRDRLLAVIDLDEVPLKQDRVGHPAYQGRTTEIAATIR